MGGLMLLHVSRKNVSARVELSGAAYMTVLGVQKCVQCMPKTAQVIAETAGWWHARTAMLQISWLERSMEGADAAPRGC